MYLLVFQGNLNLIKNFIHKLNREDVPITMQKILLRAYADDLRIRLTDNMIGELLLH
jgi:hypothetical protein